MLFERIGKVSFCIAFDDVNITSDVSIVKSYQKRSESVWST